MQEDFLHYIWKFKKFSSIDLKTTSGAALQIMSTGEHNHNSGPDFFNAKIKIGEQLWAGNVEIHLKSSDWFLHNHELDRAYDNVILHVVWEDNTEIFRKNNMPIPTLQLKDFVNPNVIESYKNLMKQKNTFLKCKRDIKKVDQFTYNNWIERMYLERLQDKSTNILKLLNSSKNNWEEVCFKLLAKNFGLKINADAFFSLANSVSFSILRKERHKLINIEALFFGQMSLLDNDCQDSYFVQLKKEYNYLKQKYKLNNNALVPVTFFRLRPVNFPTIRLAQLSDLLHTHQNIFSKVVEAKSINDLYNIFQAQASEYWNNHYTFGKTSVSRKKTLSKSFIDLILINTIIPLLFTYNKHIGKDNNQLVLNYMKTIRAEKNTVINTFIDAGLNVKTALDSQSLLQLKTEYCTKNKCLQCAIGSALLKRNM